MRDPGNEVEARLDCSHPLYFSTRVKEKARKENAKHAGVGVRGGGKGVQGGELREPNKEQRVLESPTTRHVFRFALAFSSLGILFARS